MIGKTCPRCGGMLYKTDELDDPNEIGCVNCGARYYPGFRAATWTPYRGGEARVRVCRGVEEEE